MAWSDLVCSVALLQADGFMGDLCQTHDKVLYEQYDFNGRRGHLLDSHRRRQSRGPMLISQEGNITPMGLELI